MNKLDRNTIKREQGLSIVEVIIAIGIFSIISFSIVSLILGNYTLLERGGEITEASLLVDQGIEAVRSIYSNNWNDEMYDRSAVYYDVDRWRLMGAGTIEDIGKYRRTIDFFPVYRNANLDVVSATTSGAILDPLSKKVRVDISWDIAKNKPFSMNREELLSNWNSFFLMQDDWSGNAGSLVFDNNTYFSMENATAVEINGENGVALKETATSTYDITAPGIIESSAYNTGTQNNFYAIEWLADIPATCETCEIKFQIQTADNKGGVPGAWTGEWCGPEGIDGDESDFFTEADGEMIHKDHNGGQWIKYRAELISLEDDQTPILRMVRINIKKRL